MTRETQSTPRRRRDEVVDILASTLLAMLSRGAAAPSQAQRAASRGFGDRAVRP